MVFPDALPLVPLPTETVVGDGRMPVTAASRIIGDTPATEILRAAWGRRGASAPDVADDGTAPVAGDIVLRLEPGTAADLPAPAPRAGEGYQLRIDDHVELTAPTEAGLFYGVQTLLQLLRPDAHDGGWSIPRVVIRDAPRFAHRGVMLDVVRHFFDVDEVRRFIDATSALKFNRLHLHLTDDQGWRVHIDAWPLLTERASATAVDGDRGGFYTKDDYRAIVAHAASRHMVVIPEIDLPGHTHAIGVAYPDLVEEPVLNDGLVAQAAELGQDLPVKGEPYRGWGVGHSSVRIRDERTYGFVTDVVREIAEMTPGPYIHLGGDESLGTTQDDFDHFAERATRIVVEAGKIPMGWHEMGAAEGIAEGTVGQYWGMTAPSASHAAHAAHFVERGGALVMSAADATYLDMKYDADFPLGLSWAGLTDVRTAYEWEPTAVLDLPDDAILGTEAPLWSETTRTLSDVERLVFPRAAAAAEVAWSPRHADGRTWESFRTRVGGMAPLWKAERIDFHPAAEIAWSDR
ncbi:family 20 glycosylhydrolase [uncultured Microbacterium sp.]|uniref:family 20 glycosylhydrolase n=1 Tax=uncultured Microbacterium sp. TaxID=191216 RepID=UPI0028DC10B8|nr:family 20 glycosylhydrolase [uncultured Microbacterium sp.]